MHASLDKLVVSTWDSAYVDTLEIASSMGNSKFTLIDSTNAGVFEGGIKSQNIF